MLVKPWALKKIRRLRDDESGVILIIVSWVLVILAILAISLGHLARVNLSLTKHFAGKISSRYIAFAGVNYAMEQVRRNAVDPNQPLAARDTAYECGFRLKDNQITEDIFKDIPVGDGHFDVAYPSGQGLTYGLLQGFRTTNFSPNTRA